MSDTRELLAEARDMARTVSFDPDAYAYDIAEMLRVLCDVVEAQDAEVRGLGAMILTTRHRYLQAREALGGDSELLWSSIQGAARYVDGPLREKLGVRVDSPNGAVTRYDERADQEWYDAEPAARDVSPEGEDARSKGAVTHESPLVMASDDLETWEVDP